MSTNPTKLTLNPTPNFYEPDPHQAVRTASVATVHVLPGETELEDITVVSYHNLPYLSFYDVYGRLIDVDHYLPDSYRNHDKSGADALLESLRIPDPKALDNEQALSGQVKQLLERGDGSLAEGLRRTFALMTDGPTERKFLLAYGIKADEVASKLPEQFRTLKDLLLAYLQVQYATSNQYVYFTPQGNIVITPLNKRSGVAVIIETSDERGRRLLPGNWRITRTLTETQLEKALVFRTPDVQAFFDPDVATPPVTSASYSLTTYPSRLVLDSLKDNTNNLLTVPLHADCWQVLSSDPEVIVALSEPTKVAVINTHRSVAPQKWIDYIDLPTKVKWMRADENVAVLFCLLENGGLAAYDVTGAKAKKLTELAGPYAPGFSIDRTGGLAVVGAGDQLLERVNTNVTDLQLPGQEATFANAFKDLSELFRGERLFTQAVYAKRIDQTTEAAADKLPSAVEAARFDFETNIDHLLAEAEDDYDALLEVRQKMAIARRNISEEFTSFAEREGIRLVGQRLQQMVTGIVRPAERRVTGLVESIRSQQLLEQAQDYQRTLASMTDPGAYRDALNAMRAAEDELRQMVPENIGNTLAEFKAVQTELNGLFSRQIAEDGNALQAFITGEIEKIEETIAHTHEPRQLESLLSTHPAALELLHLLKQPFVLQSIAAERALSPAGIQSRLYEAVEKRLQILKREQERKEAERNAAKLQLAEMIRESIDFFIEHHSGGFSDIELSASASYQSILKDINKLERVYTDTRLANELRARLERVILDHNRKDLERAVAYEGKYAFVQNDPQLYVDLQSTVRRFPEWSLELIEKSGGGERYLATFIRDSDREVYRPSSTDNLRSGRAFEIHADDAGEYLEAYERYEGADYELAFIEALWAVAQGDAKAAEYPQFNAGTIQEMLPTSEPARRALGAAREKKRRDRNERTRDRNVPQINPEFIDETPYFQAKLREFFIKAKLQLGTGAGVLLLSGPPSTGKSAFLKFASALMQREYFEHASDKWQTKNSLVTAIRFGEQGPYTTPAGFTRAITTAHSLINIEEIKEWPEALRKSLNPFFAGSNEFVAPDGTVYKIGDNILLCAAANLGSMYREEDIAFSADFWSRIEVVEYDYAPHVVTGPYYEQLHQGTRNSFLTMQELLRFEFGLVDMPSDAEGRARSLAMRLLSFLLLPKADDKVKRDRLKQEISVFFERGSAGGQIYGPEEATKVALRRVRDLQGFSPLQFFDLYDHFINRRPLRDATFARWQTTEADRYEHLRILFLTIFYLEGCLRHVRELFQRSGGQTEIEGTNREFINSVYLLGLLGRLNG